MPFPFFGDAPTPDLRDSSPRRRSRDAVLKILGIWLIFFLVWTSAGTFFFRFPLSVLSGDLFRVLSDGELFSRPFDVRHAGMALDQPTIGKYLLWFSVFSTAAAPYAWIVRKTTDLADGKQYAAFALPLLLTAFWAWSLLSWPACLLIQYMASYGLTPMRAFGAGIVASGALGWLLWTIVLLHRKPISRFPAMCALALLTGPACMTAGLVGGLICQAIPR